MTKQRLQTMVIDASVARSAGSTDHHRSRDCREFLQWLLRHCHRLAISADIEKEWKKHQSNFTLKWRVAMEQRGKVQNLGPIDCGRLKNRIQALDLQKPSQQRLMQKDALLVVAAQATDRVIVSLDNAARDLFAEHAKQLRTPRGLRWRNPAEEAIPWI